MPGRTVITTSQIKKIRELVALGVPKAKIARDMKLNKETVARHSSPASEARVKAWQKKRYDKERKDPVFLERRRATARAYAAKKREEYKASGVRADGKPPKLPRKVTEPMDIDQFVDELLVTDKVILDTLGGE